MQTSCPALISLLLFSLVSTASEGKAPVQATKHPGGAKYYRFYSLQTCVPAKPDFISTGPVARIGHGVTLTLFVGDITSQRSWRADGRTIQGWFGFSKAPIATWRPDAPTGELGRAFAALVEGNRYQYGYLAESFPSEVVRVPALGATSPWDIFDDEPTTADSPKGGDEPNPYPTIKDAEGMLPQKLQSTDVYVGYSVKPWQDRATYFPGTRHEVGAGVNFSFLFSQGPDRSGSYAVMWPPDRYITDPKLLGEIKRCAFRFYTVDIQGNDHGYWLPYAGNASKIQRIVLQTRPLTWVEFKGVRLRPLR